MEGAQKPRFPSRQFCSDHREATGGGSEVPTFLLCTRWPQSSPGLTTVSSFLGPKHEASTALLQGSRRQEVVRGERTAGEARRAAGGRAAWARTGQDSPPGGWQVTPQARTGPEVDAGAQGAGSADGEQVPGLRQPHPGPNTGPGARAGDQRQGPRRVRPLRPV